MELIEPEPRSLFENVENKSPDSSGNRVLQLVLRKYISNTPKQPNASNIPTTSHSIHYRRAGGFFDLRTGAGNEKRDNAMHSYLDPCLHAFGALRRNRQQLETTKADRRHHDSPGESVECARHSGLHEALLEVGETNVQLGRHDATRLAGDHERLQEKVSDAEKNGHAHLHQSRGQLA